MTLTESVVTAAEAALADQQYNGIINVLTGRGCCVVSMRGTTGACNIWTRSCKGVPRSGDSAVVESRELGDPMRLRAIRDAVQFELNAFYFYKLAREKATNPQHKLVLERLYEAELDHLHELNEKYHAHMDASEMDITPAAEKLLSGWLFHDLAVEDDSSILRLYRSALEMEQRTRDHFRKLAAELPEGLEKELCQELASEEDEHIAMLETEMEQAE
jgi:rubrerythrin